MTDERQLGMMLGKAMNAAKPAGVIEVKTSPAADLQMVHDGITKIVNSIKSQGARSKEIATAVMSAKEAVLALAEYIPDGVDIMPLAEAIGAIQFPEIPDITPELKKVVEALDKNTAAIEAQTAVLMMDKTVAYDRDGKITKVTVGK